MCKTVDNPSLLLPLDNQLLTDSALHCLVLLYKPEMALWIFQSFPEQLIPFKVFQEWRGQIALFLTVCRLAENLPRVTAGGSGWPRCISP
jgi:hypothetical protein